MNENEKSFIGRCRELIVKYREILSYLIVGGFTTLVSLASYYICIYTVFDPSDALMLQAANIISWICAVTFAYFTNRKFVFQSQDPHMLREAAAFYLGRVGTLLMDMGFMALTVTLLHFDASWMKLADQVIVTIANYIISKKLVFIHKDRTPVKRGQEI